MKFTQQKTSTSVVFWIAFAVIAAALLITLLSVPAERPVGQAAECWGGEGTITKGYCCPPSWSKAPCRPWNDEQQHPGEGGGVVVRPGGPFDKSAGGVIIGVYDWEGGGVRIPTEDGGWSTMIVMPEGNYADQPMENFVVHSIKDDSSLGNGQAGGIPREDLGTSCGRGLCPDGQNYFLSCLNPEWNIECPKPKDDRIIPKEPKQDNLAACIDHCIENWSGSDLFACRLNCDEKYGTGPRNGDGNDKGGGGKEGLECDVIKRCPDGKNFYGGKDSDGKCTTIDSCPKKGGNGGGPGDGGTGPGDGDWACVQGGLVPECPYGEIKWEKEKEGDKCEKWVCVPFSPPKIDDCPPNAIDIKCFWKKVEPWVSWMFG